MASPSRGLFIFHRDLRKEDNKGLNKMAKELGKNIYPCFIFTPEQITHNKYKSLNCIQFMIEALADLQKSIGAEHLLFFYGNTTEVVKYLIGQLDLTHVGYNRDYTPFAVERDKDLATMCEKQGITCITEQDYYLTEPGSIKTKTGGKPYVKFTPYYDTAKKTPIDSPVIIKHMGFLQTTKHLKYKVSLSEIFRKIIKTPNDKILHRGGRVLALKQLKEALKTQRDYKKTRDYLNHPTSQLSAYIKFGCVSIREVAEKFKHNTDFIRQLYWRDFYAHIMYVYPGNLHGPMKADYKRFPWSSSEKNYTAWCEGKTGFPVIDALMTELNTTGYMHNRGRLLVSSFLSKILLLNWKKGEEYFAKKLVDYDVASNNGNWQWTAGSGVDSQQYLRIFNPWIQTKLYDPNCEFIKTWLPQFKDVDNKIIFSWETEWENNKGLYYKPICNYKEQRRKSIDAYESL